MIAAKAESCLADPTVTTEIDPNVEIYRGLAAAEALWRAFEPFAVTTPFQRFDWVAAYVADASEAVCTIAARDRAGRLQFLCPVTISNSFGCRLASLPGGKHSSFGTPLLAQDTAYPSATEIGSALAAAGRQLGVDAFHFAGLPTSWDGRVSPLASWGRPAPSPAYILRLSTIGDETLARGMSRDGRRKLRSKERRLNQLGRVTFVQASSPDEIDRLLSAFFGQKDARFRELGIHDPFASEEVRRFLRRGLGPVSVGSSPALELFALTLDGEPVALLGAAVDGAHLCGMFNSFDAQSEAARLSPGDLLVSRVIRHACERGMKTFDLGVGDARYKRTFCDETVPLADVVVPVTPRGRLFAAAHFVGVATKRRFKASSSAMGALAAFRRARSGE